METKNECLDMELLSLEKALCNGYSIKGVCKGAIREVTIHPRLHMRKGPFVTATSSKSVEEALWNAAENYERWTLGQPQIEHAQEGTLETNNQQTKTTLVFLDMVLFDGPIMKLTKTKDGVKCQITDIHIKNFIAIREGKGKTIFDAIWKAMQRPIQIKK